MALSGTFYTNYYNSNIRLKLSWTGTQNVANNTTKISWTLTSNGGSSGSWWMSGPVTVKIGSTTVLNTTSRFKMYGGGAYKKTGNVTITHKNDGSQSVAMSVKAAIYSSSVNCTGSNTYTLDKIDRYALLTWFPPFTDVEAPTIDYINPQGPELVTDLKVRITWNNNRDYTSWYNISDWTGGQYTIRFSAADRELMRAAAADTKNLSIKYDLQSTMDGSDWHDYKDSILNIVNANPIMGAVSYYDANPDTVAITGDDQIIIQSSSTLVIHTDPAQGVKGATIEHYKIDFNGHTYFPDENGDIFFVQPNLAGTYTAYVYASDSRGNVSEASIDIPIYGWSQPSAQYSLERAVDFTTNQAILHVDGTIADSPGNVMQITESHREKDTGTWSTPVTIPDDTDYTINGLDYQKEYEIKIEVSDTYTRAADPPTNTIYLTSIGRGIPIAFFDVLHNSVAVNGLPDADAQLYVGGTIKAKPNDTDDGIVLPHTYSTTEQVVGYWLDGSPIYEMTIQASSDVTVAANAWLNNAFTVTEDITVLDGTAMYYSSQYDMYTVWKFMALQTNTSNKKAIDLYNARNSSCVVNVLTIRYIKAT